MSEGKRFMLLAKKPLGENEIYWNNDHMGTTRAVACEICGTEHPERDPDDDSRTISTFLGRQVVEECCGGIIDIVFRESGEEIAEAYLKAFAENPTDPKFYIFINVFAEALGKARENIKKTCKPLKEAQGHLDEIVGSEK